MHEIFNELSSYRGEKKPYTNFYTVNVFLLITARVVQLVRTLISCIKNENSNFSSGLCVEIYSVVKCVYNIST